MIGKVDLGEVVWNVEYGVFLVILEIFLYREIGGVAAWTVNQNVMFVLAPIFAAQLVW